MLLEYVPDVDNRFVFPRAPPIQIPIGIKLRAIRKMPYLVPIILDKIESICSSMLSLFVSDIEKNTSGFPAN